MFVSKAYHASVTRLLEENIRNLQEAHQREVAALTERIADLRSLVFSPTRADIIPEVQLEADSIITQNDPGMDEEADEELRERDRLFSGAYEDFQ